MYSRTIQTLDSIDFLRRPLHFCVLVLYPIYSVFRGGRTVTRLVKSQFVTSRENTFFSGQGGGRRKFPYAFTEQGIYMLATVLKGELATKQSIFIMRAFKEMRHFIANNALMFEKINAIELKQLEYQKDTDEKFGRIFEYMANHEEENQKIFYDGQIFDAFSFLTDIIGHAKKEIVLIDGYIDVITLNILAKKNSGVDVFAYTLPSARISSQDINNFTRAQFAIIHHTEAVILHIRICRDYLSW